MTGPAPLALSAAAGALIGAAFFGGLWLTLRRLPGARRPGLLAAASYALRLGLAVAGFAAVSGGRWDRLAACLAGFVAARIAMARRLGPGREREAAPPCR
ncbi:ATP synthase subunit I [Dissulfurirhabdus thermomarina]|uniref:ATP synthase subunit I n=1 Tax=Dissulfurirhabdus thermomarina TaxID=1765737 RepID=A0A6N9TK24_DISTH|nr:ATP synthase subunit I [Dissulfurirhabdus thermomarina]NDY41612.1 ATP synthase subunit I [Dissulfurirhabdus thermomarina]NMX23345.1 ATP synthase subunit I [Dissulfurirhabdus thermomarina]